jgi:hypothetical protein
MSPVRSRSPAPVKSTICRIYVQPRAPFTSRAPFPSDGAPQAAVQREPGLGFRHFLYEPECLALAAAIDTIHADPASTLLLDSTCLIPFAHVYFSYARFTASRSGNACILAAEDGVLSLASLSLRTNQATRADRRTSLRLPSSIAGMGGQSGTRPATALQICAFEQCRS